MALQAHNEKKPWPGSSDGRCPECRVMSDGWDLEYHVGVINQFGAFPVAERLVGLRCPSCRTAFKVEDT